MSQGFRNRSWFELLRREGPAFAVAGAFLVLSHLLQPLLEARADDSAAVVAAGDLEVSAYWAKAMLPGQPAGAGYLSVTNKGTAPDRLASVSSPAAGMAEIHTMEIVDDVMTMRRVEGGLEIPAGVTVELKSGGIHLMFMQVAEPFREGATVQVTLEFEKAGKVQLALPVRKAGGNHTAH